MKYQSLVKAGIKQHKGSLFGIFFLIFLVSLSLGTILTVWANSGSYIQQEIDRAGFGNLTAWVSNVPNLQTLIDEISALEEISKVEPQNIIYANYTINNQESDSEGQLISYKADNRYHFFTEGFSGYLDYPPQIMPGEIYISPSIISMFGVSVGDKITFPIARNGNTFTFTIKGYYEDPFMGSSLIGMKSFLICENDYQEITEIIKNSGIDGLARIGAMLHIFMPENTSRFIDNTITISELNHIINENTHLQTYAEFVHSKHAIYGFMLILQNAFSGLLLAFVFVLLFSTIIALSHTLINNIEADFANMGILKTVGYTSADLQRIQLIQYLLPICIGILTGLTFIIPVSHFISRVTITITGVLIPTKLPVFKCITAYFIIFLLLALFISLKTSSIKAITPIKAIKKNTKISIFYPNKTLPIQKKGLYLSLAFRQLITGARWYTGACIVAILLVFFTSLIGRIDIWLGADGKGMMDAFNPAEHDIGVQIFGNLTQKETEQIILRYTDIMDSYLLAMPGVAVNGVDYTANVISEPDRFHIMDGKSCMADNEIVLTEFVAADLGVKIGDSLTVKGNIGAAEYIVSGIYQCANDMGGNIGISREGYLKIGQDNPQIWCIHYFLSNPKVKPTIIEDLETTYGGDIHIHENSWPGLYGIIAAMQGLILFMYGMVALFSFTVTTMAGSRILQSEQKDFGIYKAIGFTTKKLQLTFALRFGVMAVFGSIIGTILAAVITDPLVSFIMKLAGISNFSSSPGILNIFFPSIIVICFFILFAYLAAGKIKKVNLMILISEH